MSRHKGFPGGAILPDDKDLTEGLKIERMGPGKKLSVVIDDGTGVGGIVTVKAGEKVRRGQCIAEPESEFGVRVHSPIGGTIVEIKCTVPADGIRKPAVVIEGDGTEGSAEEEQKEQWKVYSEGLIKCLRWAGITQMGLRGGSLVRRIRRAVKAGLRWVIINGVESEPLITAEVRLMSEWAEQIGRGCALLAEILNLEEAGRKSSGPRGLLALSGHRHESVRAVRRALKGGRFRLAVLTDVYPQDEEVLLANTSTGSRLGARRDPAEAGILVINVTSVWALSRAWYEGEVVTERVITVTGDGADKIGNYLVPLGMSVKDVGQQAGVLPEASRFVVGGPFRGWAMEEPGGVVTKQTTGLTILSKLDRRGPQACIRCGWCTDDCPVGIDPIRIYQCIEAEELVKAEKARLEECIECGLCSYVCPTHLPLLDRIRLGKWAMKEREKTEAWKAGGGTSRSA